MRLRIAVAGLILAGVSAVAAAECSRIESWLVSMRRSAATAERVAYAIEPPVTECEITTMMDALRDPLPRVRSHAARLLGEMEAAPHAAIFLLLGGVSDSDQEVRAFSMFALLRQHVAALPYLADAACHSLAEAAVDDHHPADAAAHVLVDVGRDAIPAIVDSVERGVLTAAEAQVLLVDIESAPALVLLEAERASPPVRAWLLGDVAYLHLDGNREWTLPEYQDDAAEVCESLSRLFVTGGTGRGSALELGSDCSAIAEAIAEHLDVRDSRATARFLTNAPETSVLPVAAKAFRAWRPDEDTFFEYLDRLGDRLHERDVRRLLERDVVPLLRHELNSPCADVRTRAADSLGNLGDISRAAVPELAAHLTDLDDRARLSAAQALIDIGRDDDAATAVQALLSSDAAANLGMLADVLLSVASPAVAIEALALKMTSTPAAISSLSISLEEADVVAPVGTLPLLADLARTIPEEEAARLIDTMARSGTDALPFLIATSWSGESPETRAAAFEQAMKLTVPAERGVLRRAALESGDTALLSIAIDAAGPDLSDEEACRLALLLGDTDGSQRDRVIEALLRAGRAGYSAAAAVQAHGWSEPERHLVPVLFAIAPGPRVLAEAEALITGPTEPHGLWLGAVAMREIPDLAHEWLVPLLRDSATALTALEIMGRSVAPPPREVIRYLWRANADAETRSAVIVVLARLSDDREARELLSCYLDDELPYIRVRAAEALRDYEERPEVDTILAESFVEPYGGASSIVQRELHETLQPRPVVPQPPPPLLRLSLDIRERLPQWPLPPPRWSAYDVIPSHVLGRANANLAEVRTKLATALRGLGYTSQGLFEVRNGFALMTMIERIRPSDGKPYRPPDRWLRTRIPPESLSEYLEVLLIEKPGRFRIFVFVVTPLAHLGTPEGELTETRADEMFLSAGRVLPAGIGGQPYAGHFCHVLVYTLEKKAGGRARLVANDPLQLSGHLTGAGIAAALGLVW